MPLYSPSITMPDSSKSLVMIFEFWQTMFTPCSSPPRHGPVYIRLPVSFKFWLSSHYADKPHWEGSDLMWHASRFCYHSLPLVRPPPPLHSLPLTSLFIMWKWGKDQGESLIGVGVYFQGLPFIETYNKEPLFPHACLKIAMYDVG